MADLRTTPCYARQALAVSRRPKSFEHRVTFSLRAAGWGWTYRFLAPNVNIPKAAPDTAKVTINDQQEATHGPSTNTKTNDPRRPPTAARSSSLEISRDFACSGGGATTYGTSSLARRRHQRPSETAPHNAARTGIWMS